MMSRDCPSKNATMGHQAAPDLGSGDGPDGQLLPAACTSRHRCGSADTSVSTTLCCVPSVV